MKDLISIIVPVFNIEEYLSKCLISLINQTYSRIEIICVNDGSSDNSLGILENFSQKDSRIKIISQKNQGLSAARNTGIANAQGEYVVFVDGDDWVDVNMCEIAYKTAKKTKADIVMWSYIKEYPNVAKEQLILGPDFAYYDTSQVKQLQRRLFGLIENELAHVEQRDTLVTAWGKLYKAETINDLEFVDTNLIGTEDALYNIYAFGNAKSAAYIPKCLYHYRKDNINSLTTKYNEYLFDRWQNLYEYMYQYIKQNKLSDKYVNALYNRIALGVIALVLNVIASDKSMNKKKEEISMILSTDRYQKSFRQLDIKPMSINWKLFFWFAKLDFSIGVLLLGYAMQFLRGR